MSMISEQVRELKELADGINEETRRFQHWRAKRLILEAVDTIEILSAKLAAANMERSEAYYNDGWIYCGDGNNLPEKTGFYMVTKEIRETGERFTGKSRFDSEKGWNDPLNFVDIVAWQPLPLEYKGHPKEGGDSK